MKEKRWKILNFEFWILFGIALIVILVLNYLIIIRSWFRFINEQRYRNEMYQQNHNANNDQAQEPDKPEENESSGEEND